MRYALVLTAAALLAPAPVLAAEPKLPPITFQTHSVDRVLNDLRAAADLIGGEKAVKSLNDGLKQSFGEKGFDGLDLSRPIVGYVTLDEKPENITGVVAFPVTGEKEFLALCDRTNKDEHKDLGKGLYQVPAPDAQYKARLRFSEGYAYLAYGANPEPVLDPKALVPVNKIFNPAEKATITGTFHFDRLTPELKKLAVTTIADLKKKITTEINPNDPNQAAIKPVLGEMEKLALRYLTLLGGADAVSAKFGFDIPTGEAFIDATLTPKPGTDLAKEIAARKPATNRFAGLFTRDTIAGLKFTSPYFAPEIRSAVATATEESLKETLKNVPEAAKATVEELFKCQVRSQKAGEGDVVLALNGPDKDGFFTAVGAMSFEDPSALEKEFRKYMEKENPLEGAATFKWDAEKVGKVGVHTLKVAGGVIPPEAARLFGEDAAVAFAFAPKGIYIAVGPNPIATLKDALSAKPAASAALDVVINPARLAKFVEKAGGDPLVVERSIGKDDKLMSAISISVLSDKELTLRFALNMGLIPRAIANNVGGPGSAPPIKD